MRSILLLAVSAGILAATATIGQGATGKAPAAISFSRDIQPIFDENCVACHQPGSAEQGLMLDASAAYRHIVGVASKESKAVLVVPGQPDQSYLLAKLSGSQARLGGRGQQMPLGDPLPPAKIALVRAWIAAGAPRN